MGHVIRAVTITASHEGEDGVIFWVDLKVRYKGRLRKISLGGASSVDQAFRDAKSAMTKLKVSNYFPQKSFAQRMREA